MAINESFVVGQRVRASASAQGLVRGAEYVVVERSVVRRSFLGEFVSYAVRAESGAVVSVGNAGFVLDGVAS
jgi:hypothetical protein